MFLLVPIGLEDAPASRLPRVTLAIAAICIAVYWWQGSGADWDEVRVDEALSGAMEYWAGHPYLDPPDSFEKHLVPGEWSELVVRERAKVEAPSAAVAAAEQARLERLCERALDEVARRGWRRWSLVPARGAAQPGWLSHMFLHVDFWHLAGNLLFLALAAPLIEGTLGGVVFLLFFVAGGLVAGFCQAALDFSSPIPNLGASGAVAACMGAVTVRHASQRIRFYWWVFPAARGIRAVPAWLAGGAWALREVAALDIHATGGGVAVMAHLAGFGFGGLVAVLLRLTKVERHLVTKLADDGTLWRRDPSLQKAAVALAAGAREDARAHWTDVVGRDARNRTALEGLFRLVVEDGRRDEATRLADQLLTLLLHEGRTADALALLVSGGHAIAPAQLRPALAVRAGELLESSEPTLAADFFEAAAATASPAGERARARLEALGMTSSCLRPMPEPARFFGRVVNGFSVELGPDRIVVETDRIQRVDAGIVGRVLVIDLELRDPSRRRRLRFTSDQLGLGKLFPEGTPPKEALQSLLRELASHGARTRPAREELLAGRFPRYDDLEMFEAA